MLPMLSYTDFLRISVNVYVRLKLWHLRESFLKFINTIDFVTCKTIFRSLSISYKEAGCMIKYEPNNINMKMWPKKVYQRQTQARVALNRTTLKKNLEISSNVHIF